MSATILTTLIWSGVGKFVLANAETSSHYRRDDGTYKQMPVQSFDECVKLCQAEGRKCRGSLAEQPDITKPAMMCLLNDGSGANPAFPATPPTPLVLSQALADMNAYRVQKGLSRLQLDDRLNAASQIQAQDMADHAHLAHQGSDGSHHGERVQRQGYYFSIAGENIASGQKSWARVFKAWQDSPHHNENLLLEQATDFGIAVVYVPSLDETYWAMLVAAPLKR